MIQDTERRLSEKMLEFIQKSPTCFHAVENCREELENGGFQELQETGAWRLERGGKYYVTRNLSALIAFCIPGEPFEGFQILAAHGDSPSFRVKEHPQMGTEGQYVRLNVEKYGGMIDSSWMDRPLSVAGRLAVSEAGKLCSRLVQVNRDLLLIPNLAIHMNREINRGFAYQPQKDLIPLMGMEESGRNFMKVMAEAAGVEKEQILGMDLFLYNRMPGSVWGAGEEFVSSGRLDDLQCVYAGLQGLLEADASRGAAVFCVLDNEEVGSNTRQGAGSTFLKSVLKRICRNLGMGEDDYYRILGSSFMLSADNAHGVHPNCPEKADATNRPYLNGGIVLKFNGNQKYTTDGVSQALCRLLCERAEVPWQTYANRSDLPGGSTLGNISNTQAAMNTADIGLAQLAMHSAYETAGVRDTWYLKRLTATFFESGLHCEKDGTYQI